MAALHWLESPQGQQVAQWTTQELYTAAAALTALSWVVIGYVEAYWHVGQPPIPSWAVWSGWTTCSGWGWSDPGDVYEPEWP